MTRLNTDYLIIGSGAVGLAFADTLQSETDAHITLVDRHGKPGGHWNDAYSFVALHQPSAFYGVNSMELGTRQKDTFGVNKGLYELASGPEVSGYFDRVMHQRLLPSGRVSYHPMCNYVGDGKFVSLLSGAQTEVTVRKKVVDATFYATSVPATHTPKFKVAPGTWLEPPNALPNLWQSARPQPAHYVILGAGKTAMDVGVWLLNSGASPDAIHWVMPRDSWLVNRITTQPGPEFFHESIGAQADQMEAFALATSIDDLCDRLEACGSMLRIFPDHKPTMFHYATISQGEVELLRTLPHVIRMGHVQAVGPDQLVLDHGKVPMPSNTLYIDCTASAIQQRAAQPIFQKEKLVLQLVRAPLPTFSAALVAYVEAHFDDDDHKNRLCAVVPFPDRLEGLPRTVMANMMNQFQWAQDKVMRQWIRESRLDGFGKMMSNIDPADLEKQGILRKLRASSMSAMGNLPKLMVD